ncbi:CUB and sushi domain-containing protein 1-like [Pecten maximus]|uniref:CUB and sushi domain-containing protein 1-like n=1 Tax=Pecten maximus TaxID=6579 RepID=UPI001458F1AD|nr:CUB and sushi domain-containing protein 1-like [Pecten maximus]
MGFFDIRLFLYLALLLLTGTHGEEDKNREGEDFSNSTGYTTSGYSGTTTSDRLGVITSPGYPGNYPNNYHFRYDIYLGKEKSDVEINFKIFDLEYCSNCNCDYIQIENYKLAKPLKYCGAALPNGNGQVFLDNLDDYVWITFHSNSDQRRPGFYATYEVTRKAGNDSFLAGGSVCPPLICPYCNVGQTPEYDYTSVCPYCYCRGYQENTSPNYHQTTLCPPVVCPACPHGFHQYMDYTYLCTHCYCVHDQGVNTTDSSNYGYNSTSYRPWRPRSTTGYYPWRPHSNTTHYWGTTVSTFDQGCGVGYFYSSTGMIKSPGAPRHSYPNNANCQYNIDLGGVLGTRKTVALSFNFFELEHCSNCQCDALIISSDETSGVRMCDNKVNTSRTYYVHTSSDILELRFTTDGSVVMPGFSVNYEVLSSEVNDTCGSDHCSACNGQMTYDYFGCCFCSSETYNNSTSGYYMTSPSSFSPSLLLQVLTNIEHDAQTLEQYARNLENEANYAKSLVAQNFG